MNLTQIDSAMVTSSVFEELRKIINSNEYSFENIGGSEEGLDLVAIYTKVTKSFSQTLNTLQTKVLNNFQIPKSNLTYFIKSNRAIINKIDGLSYDKVMDVDIPCPRGLVKDFSDAGRSINKFFIDMRISSILEIASKLTVSLYKEFSKETVDLKKIESLLNETSFIKIDPVLEKDFIKFKKLYDLEISESSRPFRTLFSSMRDFSQTKDLLEENNKFIQKANLIEKEYSKIDSHFIGMREVIQNEEIELSKKIVLKIMDVIEFLAKYISIYGTMCTNAMVLENNLINIYTLLIQREKKK